MRITNNLTAKDTYTQYSNNNVKIGKATQKLSSGSAINSAADNAAGLAISEKMRAQIRGLDKASANAQDAISLVQTAEGSLDESTSILQKMRQLAVQSASDTNESEIDREALQAEFEQLQEELDDIAKNTTFNKKNLLDGSLASTTKNVNVTSLANSKTAVSVGNASAGKYEFTVSVKQETAAVKAEDAAGTASLGTTAKATIDSASVSMGTGTKGTALYNGNYSFSSSVDTDSGSITIQATGDNGKNFSCTKSSDELKAGSSLSLNFESSDGADDSFTLTLNLASTPDPESANSLETLATAIDDVTVSVDGGVDAVDATYGVYANSTGASSVKLKAGDNSVTFDNAVTVSFDKLTATDVSVDSEASEVMVRTDVNGTKVAGTGTVAAKATFDFSSSFNALHSGDDFAVQIGDKTYSGVYKGETGESLKSMLEGLLAGSESNIVADTGAAIYTMAVTTTGEVSYTANSAVDGANITTTGGFYGPGSGTAIGDKTAGTATAAATFKTDAIAAGDAGAWEGAVDGTTVNYQIGDTVYSGTYDTSVDKTLSNILNGKSVTDDNGVSYNFSGASGGKATFTSTTVGVIDQAEVGKGLTTKASLMATGDKATISDGLANKLGTANDKGTSSTTATTFTVETKANDGLTFQVGANEGDEMTIHIEEMNCKSLGVNSAKVSTREGASAAISAVDDALNQVSSQRAYLGAIQNRLDHKIANLDTSGQNLTAAESQIRDVDMAKEMTEFTNAGILQQASVSMLAQANSQPQSVLSLLG